MNYKTAISVYQQQWQRREKEGHILKFTGSSRKKRKKQANMDKKKERISIGNHVYRCIRLKLS